jgi:predicted GNAT family N-acyltransferase
VEQNCVYLDLDGKDKLVASFAEFEGKVVAHARLIKPGISLITLREEWLSTLITVTESGGMI